MRFYTLRSGVLMFAIAASLAAPAFVVAQIPETFENLQVLPEDIPRSELIETMRNFSFALNVRCTHCHVGEEGQPFSTYDFPSDEKETKQKARFMLQMVRYLNEERLPQLAEIGPRAEPSASVSCETCHSGLEVPRTLRDELGHVAATEGTDAAIDRYNELREEWYGLGAYNFGEQTLVEVASVVGEDDPGGAIRIFELNLEHHAKSIQSWVGIAQAHAELGNRDQALEAVDSAEAIMPDNPFLQRLRADIEGG